MLRKKLWLPNQKPNYPVELNWSNPILRAIDPIGVYVFIDGVPVNLVTGVPARPNSTTGVAPPGRVFDPLDGQSMYSDSGTAGNTARFWNTGYFADSTYRFIAVLERLYSTPGIDTGYTNGSHDGTRRFYVSPIGSTTAKQYFGWGGAAYDIGSRTAPVAGQRDLLAMSVTPDNKIHAYLNGTLLGVSAAQTFTGTSTRNIYIGKRTGNFHPTEDNYAIAGPAVGISLFVFGKGAPDDYMMAQLYANPWQILKPKGNQIIVDYAASSGTVFTPGQGIVSVTGEVLTSQATANVVADVGAGAAGITGQSPPLGGSTVIDAGVGAGVFIGTAPIAAQTNHQYPQPGNGTALLVGQVPTVAQTSHQYPQPGSGAVSFVGQVPAVAQTSSQYPATGTGAVSASGQLPTAAATAHQYPAPGTGALLAAGQAPSTVQTVNQHLQPGVGALAVAGYSSSITSSPVFQPGVGTLALAGQPPTIVAASVVPTVQGVAALLGYAPAATMAALFSTAQGALALSGQVPSLFVASILQVPQGVAALAGPAPVASVWAPVPVGQGAMTLGGQPPSMATSQVSVPQPIDGALSVATYLPVLQRTEHATAIVGAADLHAYGLLPRIKPPPEIAIARWDFRARLAPLNFVAPIPVPQFYANIPRIRFTASVGGMVPPTTRITVPIHVQRFTAGV